MTPNAHTAVFDLSSLLGFVMSFVFAIVHSSDFLNALVMGAVGYLGAQLARVLHNKIKLKLKRQRRPKRP